MHQRLRSSHGASRTRLFQGLEGLNARVDQLSASNEAIREDVSRLLKLVSSSHSQDVGLSA